MVQVMDRVQVWMDKSWTREPATFEQSRTGEVVRLYVEPQLSEGQVQELVDEAFASHALKSRG